MIVRFQHEVFVDEHNVTTIRALFWRLSSSRDDFVLGCQPNLLLEVQFGPSWWIVYPYVTFTIQ